jgi:hypothetical protein
VWDSVISRGESYIEYTDSPQGPRYCRSRVRPADRWDRRPLDRLTERERHATSSQGPDSDQRTGEGSDRSLLMDLALEFLEPLRVVGLHAAVLGDPAMPSRLTDDADFIAYRRRRIASGKADVRDGRSRSPRGPVPRLEGRGLLRSIDHHRTARRDAAGYRAGTTGSKSDEGVAGPVRMVVVPVKVGAGRSSWRNGPDPVFGPPSLRLKSRPATVSDRV